jgi:hypothetical protein
MVWVLPIAATTIARRALTGFELLVSQSRSPQR